jgi:hypothetical protein
MKIISIRGSSSEYDIECVSLEKANDSIFWQTLKVEYWQSLFDSCGNAGILRSKYAKELTKAKRLLFGYQRTIQMG